jgi:hypothetical protein
VAADERLRQRLETTASAGAGLSTHANDIQRLPPESRQALYQLASTAGPTVVLAASPGRSNLLAHAVLLEAATGGWEATGKRVAVETPTRTGAARWRALTGIKPYVPSEGADVVIVDQADRRTSFELLAIMARIDRGGGVPVLVEGGTLPRLGWMRSAAVTEVAAGPGRVDPGPAPAWTPPGPDRVPGGPGGPGQHVTTGCDAAGALVAAWADAWPTRAQAVLVGLGPPEVEGLNLAARAILAERGDLYGPVLRCGGRPVQAGDHLLALRRSASGPAPGTVLTVTGVDPDRGRLHLRWDGQTTSVDRVDARGLGYAYAATPAVASRMPNPLLVLGAATAIGRHRERVIMERAAVPRELIGPGRELRAGRSWS